MPSKEICYRCMHVYFRDRNLDEKSKKVLMDGFKAEWKSGVFYCPVLENGRWTKLTIQGKAPDNCLFSLEQLLVEDKNEKEA